MTEDGNGGARRRLIGGRARESVTGWWGRARRFLAEVRNEMKRVTWPQPEGSLRDDGRRDPDVGRSSACISGASICCSTRIAELDLSDAGRWHDDA